MEEIRARIVSVAEILGANGMVDRIDAVDRLTGTVLVSKSLTSRSVDRANVVSSRFGFSDGFDDATLGIDAVECVSLFSSTFVAGFDGAFMLVASLLLLVDGNLQGKCFLV